MWTRRVRQSKRQNALSMTKGRREVLSGFTLGFTVSVSARRQMAKTEDSQEESPEPQRDPEWIVEECFGRLSQGNFDTFTTCGTRLHLDESWHDRLVPFTSFASRDYLMGREGRSGGLAFVQNVENRGNDFGDANGAI
jgi:hypothetical protein